MTVQKPDVHRVEPPGRHPIHHEPAYDACGDPKDGDHPECRAGLDVLALDGACAQEKKPPALTLVAQGASVPARAHPLAVAPMIPILRDIKAPAHPSVHVLFSPPWHRPGLH